MILFQKGLTSRVSVHATRPRRSPQRLRQSRRYNSSQHSRPELAEGKTQPVQDGSSMRTDTNASAKPPQSNTSSSSSPSLSAHTPTSSSQSAGTAGATAGAASTPSTANAVARSRGIREIIGSGPVGRLGRWYTRVQERKPYATQLCCSIIIYLCGDLSAQFFFPSVPPPHFVSERDDAKATAQSDVEEEREDRRGGYDPWRTVRHLIVGAGSSIPAYNWYVNAVQGYLGIVYASGLTSHRFMFLHNHFNYPSRFVTVLTKVVVQQICFTPVFNTYFFSLHSVLGGATLEETWERLIKALPVSVTNSVKLWPAVTAFMVLYVPPQFRNVFSGCIAVGWQTYLSWLNQKAAREVLADEMAAEMAGGEESNTSGTMPLTRRMFAAAGAA